MSVSNIYRLLGLGYKKRENRESWSRYLTKKPIVLRSINSKYQRLEKKREQLINKQNKANDYLNRAYQIINAKRGITRRQKDQKKQAYRMYFRNYKKRINYLLMMLDKQVEELEKQYHKAANMYNEKKASPPPTSAINLILQGNWHYRTLPNSKKILMKKAFFPSSRNYIQSIVTSLKAKSNSQKTNVNKRIISLQSSKRFLMNKDLKKYNKLYYLFQNNNNHKLPYNNRWAPPPPHENESNTNENND